MVKQIITPLNNQVRQTHLSRLYFLSKGCKQVPLQFSANQIRWGHPDGYFLKSNGQKSSDNLTESHKRHCNNHPAPNLHAGNLSCHVAMAMAFYGERPTFTDRKGKPYVGICHHLVPNLLDYRPANLLCWLTRQQHGTADYRQRALKTVVPDGNLYLFSFERLRYLQDPRILSDEDFQKELEYLREELKKHPLVKCNPLDAAGEERRKYA